MKLASFTKSHVHSGGEYDISIRIKYLSLYCTFLVLYFGACHDETETV